MNCYRILGWAFGLTYSYSLVLVSAHIIVILFKLIQSAVMLCSSLTSAVSLLIRCISNQLAMLTIEIYTTGL